MINHGCRTLSALASATVSLIMCLAALAPHSGYASTRGVYVGNEFYNPTATWQANARNSGFTTLFLFTLHVASNGTIDYNGTVVVTNGTYVGASTWGAGLAACKAAPSSVNRIEATISCYNAPDFTNIKNLVASQGTGPSSILYKNFLALKNAIGVDAIQYDDEGTYDAASSVAFGNMISALGMKVTFCPYTAQSYWVATKSQLGNKVDAIYLQCYDGGQYNDPGNWINAFGGFKVQPGLWGNKDTTTSVTSKMRNWVNTLGITGGFMWLNGSLPGDAAMWSQALKAGLDPLPPAPPSTVIATPGGTAIAISWNPVAGATSYKVKRSTYSNGTYTTIASGLTNTCYLDSSVVPGAVWFYEVSGVNDGGEGANSPYVSAIPCGGTVPDGWSSQDIGTVGLASTASGCGSSFIVQAGGTGLGGAADSFNFTSTQCGTNGVNMVRLVAMQATNQSAMAGVMFRNDASSGSAYVSILSTATNSIFMQWRSTASGATVNTTPISGVAAPVYFQLLRSGSTFTGYYANDGVHWTKLTSVSIGMNDSILSGVAVTAHTNTSRALAVFDTLSSGQPIIVQQPSPNNPSRFAGADYSVSVGVNALQPIYYCWNQNGTTIPGATNSTLRLTNLTAGNAGTYSVVVSNTLGCATSTVVTLTVIGTSTLPYAQTILSDHPADYWRLNEYRLPTAYDYVAGNNGTFTNVTLYQPGYLLLDTHKSTRFGSVAESYVRVQSVDYATNGSAAFSVEAWVSGGAQTNDAGLITKGTGAGGEQFNLDCGGGNHGFRFFVRDASGSAHLASSSIAPTNGWHHLVGVCDQAHGSVILYVDGTNAAQGGITAGTGILTTTSPMTIGSRQSGTSSYDLQFVGFMEDVAVYSTALSAAQVKAHFAVATNRPPVFLNNPFDAPIANVSSPYSASLAGSASDPNNDSVVYAKVSGPYWLTISSTGWLMGTPDVSDIGTNVFVVSVKDTGGLSNTATMFIAVNSAPSFTNDTIVLATATAGQPYTNTIGSTAVDPNGDTLSFTKLSGPSWLNIAENGDISGTPDTADVGSNDFEVSVTDPGGLSASAHLSIAVVPALTLNPVIAAGGTSFSVSWSGGAGPYQVQTATNLVNPVWENVGAPISGNLFNITPTNGAAFYRVLGQ